MNTYHLFILKRETIKLYKKNSNILYTILKNLYELEEKDFVYGISVYHQLCLPVNKKLLTNYIIDKVPSLKKGKSTFKILSFFENTLVQINFSNIRVKTDIEYPEIFKIFHIYHENIFICDFKNNRHFFLDEILKKN